MQIKLGKFKQQLKYEQQILIQRISLFLGILVILAITGRFIFGLYRGPVVWMLFVTVCILFFCSLSAKKGKHPEVAGILIIILWISVLNVISYMNGGVGYPSLVMSPLIPLVAILVIGPRAGLFALILVFISLGMFMYLHGAGHNFPVSLLSHEADYIVRGILIILTSVFITWIGWHYSTRNHQLIEFAWGHALRDHLTGLANRRLIDETLQIEIDRARRNQRWLSCIIIDIDHFKDINDTYGHQAGDDAIIKIAKLLDSYVNRAGDVVGRYGGEEFLIILPETELAKAQAIAEKIRSSIENEVIRISRGRQIHVTITLGVSGINSPTQINSNDLVKAADNALYEGKANGRNKVVCSKSLS